VISGRDGAAWVAAVDVEGLRTMLYPVAPDGTLGTALSLPRVAGLAADGDVVWWITSAGQVGRLDKGARAEPAASGESGTGLAVALDGSAWVASGTEIVQLTP
jgi:streptogramin lyase